MTSGSSEDRATAGECRWLRWKGRDRADEAPQRQHGSTYSCLRTGHPWGPDDQPASHDTCDRRRTCFQPPESSRGAGAPRSDRPSEQ